MPPTIEAETPPRVRTAGKFFRRGESKYWIKAVTYGPFEPREADDVGLPPEPVLREDLRTLSELGANTLRVYEPPPASFLDACAEHGLQLIISVPWADHIDFLRDPQRRTEVIQSLKNTVARYRSHPALLGYFVGNEIQATMVRWLGARRVKRLLEDLIEAGRAVDPGACSPTPTTRRPNTSIRTTPTSSPTMSTSRNAKLSKSTSPACRTSRETSRC